MLRPQQTFLLFISSPQMSSGSEMSAAFLNVVDGFYFQGRISHLQMQCQTVFFTNCSWPICNNHCTIMLDSNAVQPKRSNIPNIHFWISVLPRLFRIFWFISDNMDWRWCINKHFETIYLPTQFFTICWTLPSPCLWTIEPFKPHS